MITLATGFTMFLGVSSILFFFCGNPTADQLEQQFLKQRTALTSGRLAFVGDIELVRRNKSVREKFKTTIWYTPESFRCDRISLDAAKESRSIYCVNCEREGYYVYFGPELHKTRIPSARVQTMSLPVGAERVGSELKFDPRVIGVSTVSFSHLPNAKLAGLIGRTDRNAPKVEKTQWQDKEAYVVEYQLKKNGAFIRTTYVPGMGYSIVKSELEVTLEGKAGPSVLKETMEAELATFGANKTWFPRKVSLQHSTNGKMIENSKLEITEAAFNETIKPEAFKLAGMDIPQDTEVEAFYPGAIGSFYWDGQKIAQEKRSGREVYQDKPPPDGNWRGWLFSFSICLAVVAVAAFLVYYWRVWKSRK